MNNESQPDRISHTPPLQGEEPAPASPEERPTKKKSYINAIYGTLDGLSTSYSIARCYFDTLYTNTNRYASDLIHEWLMTPEGLTIAVSESCIIIGLTYIANVTDKKDKNSLKQHISQYFPYLRDTFKSLKNANRSIRATFQAIDKLFNKELTNHALPIGAALGILAAMNRAMVRYSRNQRTKMLKKNIALLGEIEKSSRLTHLEYKKKIHYEGNTIGWVSLFTAFYSGLVDGLYLHMGVMTLAPLPPPLFIMVLALSAFFSLLCIITRVYEIYNEQGDLLITQKKINLTLCGIELQALIIDVLNQSKNPSLDNDMPNQLSLLKLKLEPKLDELEEIRLNLQSDVTQSYKTAFFAGLRAGLAAYGALESLMFGIFTITTLMSSSFPPSLLMFTIISGLVFLLGFAAYSVIQHYLDQQRLVGQMDNSKQELDDYITRLKQPPGEAASLNQEALRNPAEIKKMLTDRMKIIPSPQPSFQEFFEILRAFFSGIGKGQKAVDFTLYALQQADEKARYHDTPLMLRIMTLCSIIYALVFAKRASSSYQNAVSLKKKILRSSTMLDDDQPLLTEQNTLLVNAPRLEVNTQTINTTSPAPAEKPVVATTPTSQLEDKHRLFGHPSKKSPQQPQTDTELRHDEPSTGRVMALSP